MRPQYRLRQALRPAGLIASCAALAGSAIAEPTRGTVTYSNARYGYTLSLPGDVFPPMPARDREEGAAWESLDGQARFLAVATPNDSGESLQSYRAFVLERSYKGATLDYAPMRDTWFVLSGRKDGMMFYERINFACDGRYIYGWQITYPVAERQRYDRVVEAIHRGYRVGRGEDGRCGRASRAPS